MLDGKGRGGDAGGGKRTGVNAAAGGVLLRGKVDEGVRVGGREAGSGGGHR